jgi:hypothetical protein
VRELVAFGADGPKARLEIVLGHVSGVKSFQEECVLSFRCRERTTSPEGFRSEAAVLPNESGILGGEVGKLDKQGLELRLSSPTVCVLVVRGVPNAATARGKDSAGDRQVGRLRPRLSLREAERG